MTFRFIIDPHHGGGRAPRCDWDAFARGFDMACRLRSGETLTTARLVKLYGISRSTALRDMNYLRAVLRLGEATPRVPNAIRLSDRGPAS
jgi:hypothetical protein